MTDFLTQRIKGKRHVYHIFLKIKKGVPQMRHKVAKRGLSAIRDPFPRQIAEQNTAKLVNEMVKKRTKHSQIAEQNTAKLPNITRPNG